MDLCASLACPVFYFANWPYRVVSLELRKPAGKLLSAPLKKTDMHSDPISDLLTRIRNAQMAQHKVVNIPSSNLKKEVTKILFDQGFILNYKFVEEKPQGTIKIALRYDDKTRRPAITEVKRFSKPGLRKYGSASDLPRVLNGLGISIISTNKGVMTDKEARRLNIGGEILCTVY